MLCDGVPGIRLVWMTFGGKRPPLVPDPGQRVELLAEDGTRLTGFRAVSGPLTTDKGGVAVRVATEQEYQEARREGRRAVSMAWDIDKVVVPPLPWWRWRRWFTR
jgi:hypothetical protein